MSKIDFINKLKNAGAVLFTVTDVLKLFNIQSSNTLKHLLHRLKQEKIIERLIKGKYVFLYAKREPSDFEIASFLLSPSYVSLESALSYYGILEQFVYGIISVTTQKSHEFKVRGKRYTYVRVKPEYYEDFIKLDNFLIATKEKAIFDFAYLTYNGLRSKQTLQDILAKEGEAGLRSYLTVKAKGRFLKFIQRNA